jgi:DNA-binding MarR family transcriptional regulator
VVVPVSVDPPASRRPSTAPPLALPQLTGYLLRRAYAKASVNAQACIGDDTHVREVAILAILDERGPLSQRQLSDLTRVNRTIMVKLVDHLESREWVVRERNPEDRRSYALRLTAAGATALEGLRHDLGTGESLFTDALTSDERDRLKQLLLTLLGEDGWLSIDALASHVGFLVAEAHRLVRGWAEDALAPLGLDPRNFGVLSTIARDQPCTQNHLAQSLGVSPPAALTFVEDLESVGLVRRERNTDDRRFYDLRLTEAGLARVVQARAAAAQVQDRVLARLGKAADDLLRDLLTRVVGC